MRDPVIFRAAGTMVIPKAGRYVSSPLLRTCKRASLTRYLARALPTTALFPRPHEKSCIALHPTFIEGVLVAFNRGRKSKNWQTVSSRPRKDPLVSRADKKKTFFAKSRHRSIVGFSRNLIFDQLARFGQERYFTFRS